MTKIYSRDRPVILEQAITDFLMFHVAKRIANDILFLIYH